MTDSIKGLSGPFPLVNAPAVYLDSAIVEDTTDPAALDAADAGYTNDLGVRVRLAVSAGGVSIFQIRVSESADFTDSPWSSDFVADAAFEEFTLPFTLADGADAEQGTNGDGTRTVYVQARDAQNNESNVVQASIILDRVKPDPPAVSFDEGDYATDVHVHVTPNCPGADYMRVVSRSSDVDGWAPGNLDEWVAYSATPVEVTLSSNNGEKRIRVIYKDKAGNVSDDALDSITVSDDGASAPTDLDSDHADDGVWCSYVDIHTFTWNEPETIGASGIAKYLYTTDDSIPDENSPATASAEEKSFEFDPPEDGGEFIIRVRALMNNGKLGNYAEFRLLIDPSGILLSVIRPVNGSSVNTKQPLIVCQIDNQSQSGTDEDSIKLTVNAVEYGLDSPAMTWEADTGRLTFDPSKLAVPVEYTGTVQCSLDASTLAGMDATTLSWSFVVDLDAPGFVVEYFLDAMCKVAAGAAVKAGPLYLKVTPSKAMKAPPTFAIDQQGSVDVTNQPTSAFGASAYLGVYTVHAQSLPQYKDGLAHVLISGQSVAGNIATDETPTAGDSFTIDTQGPIVDLEYSFQYPLHLHPGDLGILARFNEEVQNVTVAVVSEATGATLLAATAMRDVGGNNFAYRWIVPELDEGYYVVVISATDLAGNPNLPARNSRLFFDKTSATIYGIHVVPSVASTVVGHNLVVITFRTSEPLDPDSVSVTVAGVAATKAGASANGQRWSFEYSVTGNETEGPAEIVIEGDDLAGNHSRATASVVFDFTPPTVEITRPAQDDELLTDDAMLLTWDWADANGLDLGSAKVILNGANVTERCVLSQSGGRLTKE